MNYATDTMNTFSYLFAKHDKKLREEYAAMPSQLIRIEKDKPYRKAMSEQEHDRIFVLVHTTTGMSNNAMAKKVGWSPAIISDIRKRKHVKYDAVRSEAALAKHKKTLEGTKS